MGEIKKNYHISGYFMKKKKNPTAIKPGGGGSGLNETFFRLLLLSIISIIVIVLINSMKTVFVSKYYLKFLITQKYNFFVGFEQEVHKALRNSSCINTTRTSADYFS